MSFEMYTVKRRKTCGVQFGSTIGDVKDQGILSAAILREVTRKKIRRRKLQIWKIYLLWDLDLTISWLKRLCLEERCVRDEIKNGCVRDHVAV